MPTSIAIAVAAGSVSTYVGTTLAYGALAGAVAGAFTAMALGQVLSPKPKAPQQSMSGGPQPLVTLRQPAAPWQVIYGKTRVPGVITFIESINNAQVLNLVITLAGHECEEITEVYFNDELLSINPDGTVNGRYTGALSVYKSLGNEGVVQPFPILAATSAGLWTANHLQRGHTKLGLSMGWNPNLYPDGLPNVTAVVKGKKVLEHRYSPTQRVWSDNPALCIADYLTDANVGFGAGLDEIDISQLAAAANVCDELVALNAGGTEKRYTLNGAFLADQTPREILGRMLTAMGGQARYVGGLWRLHPAAYDTPSVTLTADDLRGPVHILPRLSKRDLCNGVKGIYTSPDNDYQPSDFPVVTNATYLSEDQAERIWRDVELPFTNSPSMAQRIAKIELERNRQQITLELPCKLTAYQAQPGDTVLVTLSRYGYAAKAFEVMNSTLVFESGDGGGVCLGVDLTLRETASAVFDWRAGEETEVDPAPDTNLPDALSVDEPLNVAASSGTDDLLLVGDGTVISRMRVIWDISLDPFVTSGGFVEVQFKKAADSEWQDFAPAAGSATQHYLTPVEDAVLYDVRVRFRNVLKVTSDWVQIQHTVIGKTELPDDIVSFTIEGTRLNWSKVSDIDLAGYRLRFQPSTNRSWGEAVWLHGQGDEQDVVTSPPFDMLVRPSGQVTIMVKAVDTSGNESENPAYIVTDLGDPEIANVVESFDRKAAGFPGTKTNCAVSGGNLVANSSTLMWNPEEQADMWKSDSAQLMWAVTAYAQLTYEDRISVTEALAGSQMTITATIEGDPWSIEYRENSQAPMWGLDSTASMWDADASALMWDTPEYQPWPGQITARESIYDFRITTAQCLTQGVVSALTITIDAPDIDEFLANIAIGAGGTNLPITESYASIKGVNLTLLNDGGTAVTAKQESTSTSGPLVKCYTSGGVATTGHVNALVQGY